MKSNDINIYDHLGRVNHLDRFDHLTKLPNFTALTAKKSHLTLEEILTRSTILGEFIKKSEQLTQLNRTVLKCIEPDLSPHCRVLSFHQNMLVLSTSSSMWGHKLRFKAPDLIEILRKDPRFTALKAIQVKVDPEMHGNLTLEAPSSLPRPLLTRTSAAFIALLAKDTPFDGLKKSLLRLSKRVT